MTCNEFFQLFLLISLCFAAYITQGKVLLLIIRTLSFAKRISTPEIHLVLPTVRETQQNVRKRTRFSLSIKNQS